MDRNDLHRAGPSVLTTPVSSRFRYPIYSHMHQQAALLRRPTGEDGCRVSSPTHAVRVGQWGELVAFPGNL